IKYSGTTPAGYASATLLPSLSYLQNRSFVLLAGYGISNGTSKEGAGVLRQVMTVIANSKFSTTEIQLEQRNGHGACHGDSGGPAFIVANGNYYLWGVTSRGYRDSEDNCSQFSIYTNALAYYQWIQTTARSLALAGSVFNYAPSERSFGQGTHY
ncbi:MAG: trypsin-like serine protease, partial [Bdellovibrionales bacterium]|nr:trypsin-like serine protease [Bdellovibrionales bacterium]